MRALVTSIAGLALLVGAPVAAAADPTAFDVRPTAVEITQGTQYPQIQTRANAQYKGVALVEKQPTLVRVYASDALRSGVPVRNAKMRLRGFSSSGAELAGGPLLPVTGPFELTFGPDSAPSDAERAGARSAYTFELPLSWTTGAEATKLTAELIPPPFDGSQIECGGCHLNNTLSVTGLKFAATCCVKIAIARIAATINGTRTVPGRQPQELLKHTLNLTPMRVELPSAYQDTIEVSDADKGQVDKKGVPWNGRLSGVGFDASKGGAPFVDWGVAWTKAENLRVSTGSDIVLAVAPGTMAAGGAGFHAVISEGLTVGGMTHEVHHALGRVHAGLPGVPGCPSDAFMETWSPNQLGGMDGAGVDRLGRMLSSFNPSTGQAILSAYPAFFSRSAANVNDSIQRKAMTYDVMSYCAVAGARQWVSPRGWDSLVTTWPGGTFSCPAARTFFQLDDNTMRADFCLSVPVGTTGVGRSVPRQAPAAALGVSAVRSADGTVSIEEVSPKAPVAPAAASAYELVGRGPDNTIVATSRLQVVQQHSHQGFPAVASLAGRLEVDPARVARVEVVAGGTVLDSRDRSPGVPTGAFTSPTEGALVGRGDAVNIAFSAADPDGDAVTTNVDWSADGGKTWRPVSAGGSGTEIALPSNYFAGTDTGVLRLRVNDGFNETAVLSPTFRTVHRDPTVTIETPQAGKRVPRDATVPLTATARDERGRELGVRWLDGRRKLGRGNKSVQGLTAGTHRLRAVTEDARGRTSSAVVRVKVVAVPPAFERLEVPRVRRSARTVRIRVASTLPATLRATGVRRRVSRKAKSVAIPVSAGARALRLRLTADGKTTEASPVIRRR